MERYFISPMLMTAKIEAYAIDGSTIKLDGYTYQELKKKPRGRSVYKTLQATQLNEEGEKETYIIYR